MKMRQKINGPFPITRNSSSSQGTGSQSNLAPTVFNKNQNSALCLPLLSENQKIIWVQTGEINIPAEKAAKLNEAFNRFPYLTQKQTLSLSEDCSLHPDQVKVWFMAQRLCYGISWDSKDIHAVRRTMFGGVILKTEHKYEKETMIKPKFCRKDAEEEISSNAFTIKKNKLSNVADGQVTAENMQRRGRKRKGFKREEEIADASVKKSPSVPVPPQVASSGAPLLMVKQDKDQMETNNEPPQKQLITQGSQTCDLACSPTKKKRLRKKRLLPRSTPKQLALMKMEFIKQQYPTNEQYQQLSTMSGVPHYGLVQWFNDMRYFIKKGKPKWMSVEQHNKAVANVKYEQFIRKKRQHI